MDDLVDERQSPIPYLERALMSDPRSERELSERGYTLIDLLEEDEVALLRDFYVEHAERGDLNPEGAYNPYYAEFTTMNSRPEFRREAYELISRVVTPRMAGHLIDCRPIVANFVNKPPGGGVVPVHQNMSVVDEATARSVSVWIALVDCTVENGTIEFVDGSHLLHRGRRGTWAYQEFGEIDEETIASHFVPVPIRAGQAVVLDDAIVHYSAPNQAEHRRLAIQLVVAPAELDALYFQVAEEHEDTLDLDVLVIEPEFFFDFWGGVGRSEHAVHRDRITIERTRHDASTLRQKPLPAPAASPAPPPAPFARVKRAMRRFVRAS